MFSVIGIDFRKTRGGFVEEVSMAPEAHRDFYAASDAAKRNAGIFHIVAIVHVCEKCGRITIPDTSRFIAATKCAKCGELYRVL